MAKMRNDLSITDLVNITHGLHKILPKFYDWVVTGIEQQMPADQNLVMHLAKIGGDPGNDDDRKILMLSFDFVMRNFEMIGDENGTDIGDTDA